MLGWLLACAAHIDPVPIGDIHVGSHVEPLRAPLVPLWVEAAEDGCEHLAEGLRTALSLHGGQLMWRGAETRLRITTCQVRLDEELTVDAHHTATLPEGEEALDALLTGRADLRLEIWRSELLMDILRFDVVRVEHQDWIAGELYPWRRPLSSLTERDLIESVEVALLAPHEALVMRRKTFEPPPPKKGLFQRR